MTQDATPPEAYSLDDFPYDAVITDIISPFPRRPVTTPANTGGAAGVPFDQISGTALSFSPADAPTRASSLKE